MGAADHALAEPDRLSRRRAVRAQTVLAVASLGVFMAFMDDTVVGIAFPNLVRSFPGTTFANLSWVLNAYYVSFAALLIAGGRIADLAGRRRVFSFGLVLFSLASAACAAAPTVGLLIAARVVQGAGAAIMVPASLALVLHAFPAEQRAKAIGVWGATAALAAGLGPSIGGLLVEARNWRLVFLVNLPIGVVAYWLCARSIVESRAPGRRELPDALGFALGALALAAAAMAIVQAPESGAGSALVLGSAVVAVLAGALLVRRMRTHPSALIDGALLRMPGLGLTGAITAVGSAGFFALGLANMLYLMIVWRYSPLKAGLAMTPSPFVAAAAAVLAGQLAGRLDPRRMVMAGSLIGLVGSVLLITRMGSTPDYLGAYLPAALVLGVGIGIAFPLISDAAVSSAPRGRFAEASALNGTIRQFGATIGVAILAAVLGSAVHTGDSSPFHTGWIFAACCYGLVAVGTLWMRPFSVPTYDTDAEPERVSSGSGPRAARPAGAGGPAPEPMPTDPAALLAGVPLFAGLSADSIAKLAADADLCHVRAGGWLFHAGDDAQDLYVVRAGRLDVMADVLGRPHEVLRTVGPGAVVGELAALAGNPRSGSVRVRRDASLLRLRREDLERLLGDVAFARSLTRTLGRELQRSRRLDSGSGSRGRTVAVLLLGSATEDAARELVECLRSLAGASWLDAERFSELRPGVDVGPALAEMLDRLESEHAVVALVADSRSADWAAACLQQADRVLALVGTHPYADAPPALATACDAALLTDADAPGVQELLEHLNPRSVQRIRAGGERSGDVARLARRLSGRAVGLVLSGGGARVRPHRRDRGARRLGRRDRPNRRREHRRVCGSAARARPGPRRDRRSLLRGVGPAQPAR